jgi:outer membrane protein TolC
MRASLQLVTVLLATGMGAAAAQEPGAPPLQSRSGVLRLGELYRDLEARSPRIRAARAAAAAAEARIGPVRRPPDPMIQFGTMNRELPRFGLNEPLGMNQVQLTQMLPIGGQLGLAARSARAQADAAALRASDAWWEQRTRVATAFYQLYRSDRSLAVARETRALVQNLSRTAEAMYRVGEGRQSDVLRAQVEVARMTEDIIRIEAMREAQAAQLSALLDWPPGEPVETPVRPAYPDSLPPIDSLVALALQRPMLRAGDKDVAAATAAEQRAGREIWPDLELGIIYGQRGMPEGGTDRMMSLMLGATIPIWAGSRQGAMRREAAAMRQMMEADLEAMRAETRANVVELVAEIGRAYRLAMLYRGEVLPQTGATVSAALAAYRTGRVDFMTILDARMTENRYRTELIALDADAGRALAELEMLTATPLLDPDRVNSSSAGGAR